MTYDMNKGLWSRVFAVPSAVVDRHIRLCGEVALKVLLILLRSEEELSEENLAAMLGGKATATDIRDAMRYWMDAGVLTSQELQPESVHAPVSEAMPANSYDTVHCLIDEEKLTLREPEPVAITVQRTQQEPDKTEIDLQEVLRQYRERTGQPVKAEEKTVTGTQGTLRYYREEALNSSQGEEQRKLRTLGKGRMRLHTHEINQMAKNDENIAYLLQESQSVLGQPLTAVATETIVALYSYYGMAPDLVLMLLQYCVSMEKGSMRYVEKVAADWLEKGIDSHEKAEQEILRGAKRGGMESKIKTAFGIYDRKLVDVERKYIQIWSEEYRFDIDIITLAFERSVELKGKLSFPYINGILKKWYEKGITSAAQAAREIQDRPAPSPTRDASYEIGELEQVIRRRNKL